LESIVSNHEYLRTEPDILLMLLCIDIAPVTGPDIA